MEYAVLVLIVWNVTTFLLFGLDKRKAIKKQWRISEKTLIGASFAMGAVGSLIGMKLFKHKTKHKKFVILLPIAVLVNLVVIYLIRAYLI